MQTISEYHTTDKSAWGNGPWQNEPDKAQGMDEATGYDTLIVRNHGGALCGYVGIPETHPLFGVGYSQESEALRTALSRRMEQPIGETPSFTLLLSCALGGDIGPTPDVALQVHGGITFADTCRESDDPSHGICHIPTNGRPGKVWWYGFDCSQSGDLSPQYAGAFGGSFRSASDQYRDRVYVEREIASLASQLAAVAAGV